MVIFVQIGQIGFCQQAGLFVRRGGNDNVRFVKSESFVFDALFKIVPFPFFFADVSGLILRQVAFVFFVAEGVAGHQHDRRRPVSCSILEQSISAASIPSR